MNKQTEALNSAKSALLAVKHGQCDYTWADQVIAEIDGALAQPPVAKPHEQEPVGYLASCPSEPELGFWFSETEYEDDGVVFEPLYTSSLPAATQHERKQNGMR